MEQKKSLIEMVGTLIVIHGQIHHYIGALVPEPEQQVKYIQLYFLDPQESVPIRMGILQDGSIQKILLNYWRMFLDNTTNKLEHSAC